MQFQRLALQDQGLITPYLEKEQSQDCAYAFANLFLWSFYENTSYALVEDALVLRFGEGKDKLCFAYPFGAVDPKRTLQLLIDDCKAQGIPFRLVGLTEEKIEQLALMFPGQFEVTSQRAQWDYIYEVEKLVSLSGKKYHSKRNFINRFKQTYEWSYEPITPETVSECLAMNEAWCRENGCQQEESLLAERCVVRNAFGYFEELSLRGGLLRADGKVVAFTIGSVLNRDTFAVHIEKAFSSVAGAYPTIHQEFLRAEATSFRYVNREDDLGLESLRKAKLSYHPAYLLEKSTALFV